MGQASQAPSGTRDLLADEVRRRKAAFDTLAEIFESFGFDPLETPAFENVDVITGKYGEEASKLVFKILKRGVHEASGQPDLALRYDHTVPLARVIGSHGGKLPSPYKRYAIGPVWRADRPQEGRFREFVQCDIDTVGSHSPLADAEIVLALAQCLDALGVQDFTFMVNSRKALHALLNVYGIDPADGPGVLGTLDKLDKISADAVAKELASERGISPDVAESLVADVAAESPDRVRERLEATEQGKAGLAEIDTLIRLTTSAGLASERIVHTPRMVRGLDYYTGAIYEVVATGFPGSIAAGGRYDHLVATLGGPDVPACGGSIGIERILAIQGSQHTEPRGLDVALTVIGGEEDVMSLAAQLRGRGKRVGTYLGASTKLGRQLKWADDQKARLAVLYGPDERTAGEVTVRNMHSGEQTRVPLAEATSYLCETLEESGPRPEQGR
ncbi:MULTISPECIES: histidine--tRNA ligase [Streptomyces]|uniref:histidine--tRNA ligase n=1 Tax=Streptomyces TaxID=1883 RepID=UPI002248D841|nr:histidine--tRNA ligase [Streptomyces sp. JHD 1]MCX2968609.1 histidine--tRNA ligase [Streptomyces sp. JHD 1]